MDELQINRLPKNFYVYEMSDYRSLDCKKEAQELLDAINTSKKENDIQTYKEIVAFCEGKKLDELHKAVEAGKRPYQNILKVFAGSGVAALVCILIGLLMHIFLN